MKGSTPTQISEIIIKLIKDMAAVSFYSINVDGIQIFLIVKNTFFYKFCYSEYQIELLNVNWSQEKRPIQFSG